MHRKVVIAGIAAVFSVLALVLSGIVEAGGGGHGSCLPQERAGQTIVIQNSCYSPSVLYVEAGTTAEWQQRDGIPHDVTSLKGESVGSRGLQNGDSVTHSFEAPGVFTYFCTIHPGMWGAVIAGDAASSFEAPLTGQTASDASGTPPAWAKGSGEMPTAGWGEAAVGLGLFGGLVLGLVVAGGGVRWLRRGSR